MNKHIVIDWPFDQITLEFKESTLRKPAHIMRTDRWNAIAAAERRIYHMDPNSHGWTDVMMNDGDEFLNAIWEQAESYVRNEIDLEKGLSDSVKESTILHRTASRVAQAIAILTFGPDILING